MYVQLRIYDEIKVGLLYSNAGWLCDVKYIESHSHSASFMLDTINATMYVANYYCYMTTGQVVYSQWLYLVVCHLC